VLLYDRRARAEALELLLPGLKNLKTAWQQAALGHARDAEALVSIARASGRTGGNRVVRW
jgi:hypothetical protein